MGKLKQANEKAKVDVSYNVYQKESGGVNDVIAIVIQMDGFADMAPISPSLKERYVAAFDEKVWLKDYTTWTNGEKRSETEIMTFLPDLSSPAPE